MKTSRYSQGTAKQSDVLPPFPVLDRCPMEFLLDYAGEVLDPPDRRKCWTIALEVYPRPNRTPEEPRWFALVSLRHQCKQLFTMVSAALESELVMRDSHERLETGTVGELFQQMTAAGATVWFYPLFRQGAAIFVRKPGSDPSLKHILTHNRKGKDHGIEFSKLTVIIRDGETPEANKMSAAFEIRVTDRKACRRWMRRK